MAVCDQLGLPLHLGKCVGPAPVLTVLGIELDSVNQVARLPAEKTPRPAGADCIMVSPVLVQQTGDRVPNWSPPSCRESGMAWSHLLTSDD